MGLAKKQTISCQYWDCEMCPTSDLKSKDTNLSNDITCTLILTIYIGAYSCQSLQVKIHTGFDKNSYETGYKLAQINTHSFKVLKWQCPNYSPSHYKTISCKCASLLLGPRWTLDKWEVERAHSNMYNDKTRFILKI